MQNCDFMTRITSLCGSKTSPVVFAFKTGTSGPELQVSMGSSPHLWFCALKTATLEPNRMSPWVPDFTSDFVHAKQSA